MGFLFALSMIFSTASAAEIADAPANERKLVPVGHTVGVKLFSEGMMVVKLAEGDSPARRSGVKTGDILLTMNGVKLCSAEQVQSLVNENGDKEIALRLKRGSRTITTALTPVRGEDGVWRIGAWIRDSMAGIGTMTFYDPESGMFAALGHGITDVDTGALMPLSRGAIMPSRVKAVKRGASGAPGELRGDFDLSVELGSLYANTNCGVFGVMPFPPSVSGEAVPIAERAEIAAGKATILANCKGDEVCEYEIEIEKIYPGSSATRNLLLRVTDPALLEQTGGIVQGMSGSPILQNGKLVGAVTHVLVDDPTRGYGILIENMLQAAPLRVEQTRQSA